MNETQTIFVQNAQDDFISAENRLRKATREHSDTAVRFVRAMSGTDASAKSEARHEMKRSLSWVAFSRNAHDKATRKLTQMRTVESFR